MSSFRCPTSLPSIRWVLLGLDVGMCAVTLFVLFFLLARPPFDLEGWLSRTFVRARSDAFDGVNNLVTPPLSAVPVCWLGVGAALLIARCYKQVFALTLGPLLSASLIVPFENWSDPHWFILGAVTIVGCFAGLIVGIGWWLLGCLVGPQLTNHST